ncbi:MAG: lipocalin family protein [Bacteroidia bacterium]|nr:lipocalin family protein [Bacteroidia bacterium]
MKKLIFILFTIMIFNSAHSQKVPTVVATVDLNRYKGTWYEIARLPNSFERKLKCISATYTLRDDGKITVLNKGQYITDPHKTNTAKGVAWIPDKNSPAKLKVQFFWPFSGDYWIMYLDKEYLYVLVGDPSLKYLWILAREKKMDETTYKMLLQKAIDNGYDVKPIIRVEQDCN